VGRWIDVHDGRDHPDRRRSDEQLLTPHVTAPPALGSDVRSMNAPADTTSLERWMQRELGIEGARLGARLSGGNANVTQLVESDAGRFVIRRPPDAAISANAAQGVRREFRMLSALTGGARVPKALGFCEDTSVLGQPFAVVEHVAGVSLTTQLPAAYESSAATVTSLGHELIDAIADVHALDWRALPLDPPRDAERFLQRQIERWRKARAAESVRELPLLERIGHWLLEELPAPAPARVVHGDYHLDNTLFRADRPELAAIIDWELATIGDPLTDLGLLLMFWGPRAIEPPAFAHIQQVTRVADAPSRLELAQRWSERTGIDSAALDYYLCFAFWRLAAIVEGAYVLCHNGLVHDAYSRGLEHDVPRLLREAALVAGIDPDAA
jgi:aminoglycoside phosphotransferase (APT) family kinase protein